MEERAFRGVWIPVEIWLCKKLSAVDKIIFTEISSLDRGENHCYASNEYLAEFCQVSESTVTRSIKKLIDLNLIEIVSFNGRNRVVKLTRQSSQFEKESSQIDEAESSKCVPNNIDIKKDNNIKLYNKAPAEPAVIGVSKRNFRKDSLKDSLASGKEIDNQQKKKKEKTPLIEECLDEIERESYGFDSVTKQLLIQYAAFITDSTSRDSRRVKTLKMWQKKLTDLLSISNSDNILMQKIIKQSLDKKWYKFVEYEEVQKKSYNINKATNDGLIHQKHTREEIIAQRIANGAKAY